MGGNDTYNPNCTREYGRDRVYLLCTARLEYAIAKAMEVAGLPVGSDTVIAATDAQLVEALDGDWLAIHVR